MSDEYRGCTVESADPNDGIWFACKDCTWRLNVGFESTVKDMMELQHEHQKSKHPIAEPVQRMPEDEPSVDFDIFEPLPAGLRLAEDAYVLENDNAAVWVEAADHRIFIGMVRNVKAATNGAGIFYRLSILQDLIKFNKATINSGPVEG